MECKDKHCYRHGTIRVRGRILEGDVVSTSPKRTAIVEVPTTYWIAKFKKAARAKSKIAAHNPDCISAEVGQRVRIGETRKISATKAWTVIEVIGGKDEAP